MHTNLLGKNEDEVDMKIKNDKDKILDVKLKFLIF